MVMRLQRRPDWRARLTRYLAEEQQRPFAWGRHDCALFVAGAIEAMTGVDPAAEWRGRYRTELGARRVLRRLGHDGLASLADAHLERRPGPQAARPGDVVLVERDGIESLGVAAGPTAWVRTPDGLGALPLGLVAAAWRVG